MEGITWGIVGARKASIAGLHLASRIAKLLAENQQKIISGLAIGIDASAHQGALDSGQQSSTLAILGNGLPSIYPGTNQNLARKIIQNGGVLLSQFYPYSRAYPANFLNRNRLIAGLSDNILVIEASEQSGSRVTARYALEQGKNLYVIPGDISNPNYKGSNQLIKSGAEIITCMEDFYEFLPKVQSPRLNCEISRPQNMLLNEIQQNNGLNREDLKAKALHLGITSEVFYQELINLENDQKIKFLPGDFIQVY